MELLPVIAMTRCRCPQPGWSTYTVLRGTGRKQLQTIHAVSLSTGRVICTYILYTIVAPLLFNIVCALIDQ